MSKSAKKILNKWFSLYIRLRDALEFHKETGADISFGRCCSCGKIVQWKYADCGHYISRDLGGNSGVYFDERNAHLQCKICNAFRQGAPKEYEQFMLKKYGQKVVDELHIKHKTHTYNQKEIVGLGIYYKQEYENLCKTVSLELKTE